MNADPLGLDDWRDETELDYCPRCGAGLEGEHPTTCPEHGAVTIDYFEFPDDEFAEEVFAHAEDDEWLEMMFGADLDGDDSEFEDWLLEEIFGAPPDELEDLGVPDINPDAEYAKYDERGETPGGGVRDRINRLLGRD